MALKVGQFNKLEYIEDRMDKIENTSMSMGKRV